jgi:hypothetical protein
MVDNRDQKNPIRHLKCESYSLSDPRCRTFSASCHENCAQIRLEPEKPMSKEFKGTINLDVRDSNADWTPYEQPKAGAPNVLIVLYDDTGLASWAPFGGGE